jgi:hypothetical protein
MPALRSRVIRLAHAKPDLRPHLLPLLREASEVGDVFEDTYPIRNLANHLGSWALNNVKEWIERHNARLTPKDKEDLFEFPLAGIHLLRRTDGGSWVKWEWEGESYLVNLRLDMKKGTYTIEAV